jgi:hypothetical protein
MVILNLKPPILFIRGVCNYVCWPNYVASNIIIINESKEGKDVEGKDHDPQLRHVPVMHFGEAEETIKHL